MFWPFGDFSVIAEVLKQGQKVSLVYLKRFRDRIWHGHRLPQIVE